MFVAAILTLTLIPYHGLSDVSGPRQNRPLLVGKESVITNLLLSGRSE